MARKKPTDGPQETASQHNLNVVLANFFSGN